MATDLLGLLLHINVAASAAVLVVLAVRRRVLKAFGPELAYRLWACVPAAGFAALLPAAAATRIVPPGDGPHLDPVYLASEAVNRAPAGAVLAVWLAGAAIAMLFVGLSQRRFLRLAERGRAGPAVAGFVAPRVVMPRDAAAIYTAEERDLIRAHERAHIARGDPKTNGYIVLAQCLAWFNPLVHLAAREARLDQELACDATVLAALPGQRRRYAETLLKTQLGARAAPLGCHWLAGSSHPLEQRISALRLPRPDVRRYDWGLALVATAVVLSGLAVWKVQPPGPAEGEPPVYVFVSSIHHHGAAPTVERAR